MLLARVVGNVVATRKDPRLEGKKMLVVQQLAPDGGLQDRIVVALDTVGAGVRETVICVAGSSARMASGMKGTPVDTAVVGIVDDLSLLARDGP